VEGFDEALGCYFSTIYHSLTNELTHLSLTQALDAYHGQKHQSHSKQDFKVKIQELITPHTASLRGLVDDVTGFVEQVHATRNYYTHHNPKWKATGNVVEKSDLFRLNEKLRLLFQMCVLTDIKVPVDRFFPDCVANSPPILLISSKAVDSKPQASPESEVLFFCIIPSDVSVQRLFRVPFEGELRSHKMSFA
jgi:hypothetical protein